MPHRSDQAAELAFHLAEARKRRQDAQFFEIGRIDRADQRFHKAFEHLAPQTPADHQFIETQPADADTIVTVAFAGLGLKRLMGTMAKLEAIEDHP